MIKLEWNEELEKSAQRWADQCVGSGAPDSKDQCRDIGSIPVGQNIASVYGESPGLSPLSLVDVWYIELLNANSTVLPRYRPSSEGGTSHYDYFTQLVWALSSEVGCGGVKFKEPVKDSASIKTKTVHRLVCNFYPTGNVLREAVYSEGPPCSRCPNGGVCDTMYNSLCSSMKINKTKMPKLTDDSEFAESETLNMDITLLSKKKVEEIKTNISHTDDDLKTDDENMTVLDYFSEIYDFKREPLTESTTMSTNLCKDRLAVDEFIDLLKKKLTTDPMFKELLSTKQPSQNGNIDSGFTDPSVQAFVSRIYSKKEPSTTTKLPDQDYVNSTLLVDLVEAVIFRSGDKTYASEESKETSESQEVNPVKIQAELAEVKLNHEFTGHYFFPEDNNDEPVSETTYIDYDNSNLPVSDVISEIENLKRDKVTHDFLDELIDFDSETDESKIRQRRSQSIIFRENGREAQNVRHKVRKLRRVKLPMPSNEYDNNIEVKYADLLKKLALDLRLLNLNNRFHCSSTVNCAVNLKICKNMYLTLIMSYFLIIPTLNKMLI